MDYASFDVLLLTPPARLRKPAAPATPEPDVSIELEYAPDPKRIVEWVEEAYQQTDKSMRMTSLHG